MLVKLCYTSRMGKCIKIRTVCLFSAVKKKTYVHVVYRLPTRSLRMQAHEKWQSRLIQWTITDRTYFLTFLFNIVTVFLEFYIFNAS